MTLRLSVGSWDVRRALSFGLFSFCAWLISYGSAVNAQNAAGAADNINARCHRQMERIAHGVKSGAISAGQATKMRATVQSLQQQALAKRQPDGSLKKEDLILFENQLNQNSNLIRSLTGAGESKADGGNVVGPAWTPGKDGAQNPAALMKEMKIENRRELRQERQAIEQKLEQQQLDYEHKMIPELSNQRKAILNSKQQLRDIRKEQNAN